MKRKIIKINEDLCNGCGNCTTGCSEGALQIINGKAKLVREDFCDGFGDCIGTCPTGALTIEEREADNFNEGAVKKHLLETQGQDAVDKMETAQARHNKHQEAKVGSATHVCPGSMAQTLKKNNYNSNEEKSAGSSIPQAIPSELGQWPVQLHLVSPYAPYFKDTELVVLSTCSPIASADIHWRYLRNRAVVIACPKLDRTDGYIEKLAEIFKEAKTPKVITVIMEVPCCSGLAVMVKEAIKLSNRNDIVFEQHKISLDGKLIETN